MFSKGNGVKPANTQSSPGSSSSWAGRSDSPRREASFSRSPGNLGAVGKNSSRIDPEILLDTQSNGLSSRIVKYYEENQRISRSPRTVYNKPGQFPIVHLKKNEIVYSTKRNNPLSVVKIAPPDKSVSDRNIRLNILRQGLSTTSTPPDDYIEPHKWQDNEPLTPSGGIESTPTRSVLDALTEISRKRIHNEDFNGGVDRSKKYCKDFTEVDGSQADLRAVQIKRQRDKVSPPSPTEGHTLVESTKKKVCRNSHDILSSLSSSVRLLNPKRRIEDVLTGDAKRTLYQRPQATVEPQKRSPVASVEPQRRPDLPSSQRVAPVINTSLTIVPPKPPPKPTPKLTLFNQNYDKIKERVLSDTEDDGEAKSMNLVRPKPGGKLLVKDKEASAKGTKSKLAIMLSYLSRNFEDDEEDTVDGLEEEKKKNEEKKEEQKTPEAPKTIPVITNTVKTSEPQTPIVAVSTVIEEPKKKIEDVPSATSTPQVPQIKFGFPAAESTNKISPILSLPVVVSTANQLAEPKPEVPPPAPVISEAFKMPASTATISFSAPISFGSTVTTAPALSLTQTTPALSVTPVVSSGAFAPLPSTLGSSLGTTKTVSPFTMTPGIAGSALAAISKSPPKPVAFNFGATTTQSVSLTTTTATTSSSAAAPTNSFLQFKPVTTSTSSVTSAPSFTFGTPATTTQTSVPEVNFAFTGSNTSTLKLMAPGSVITPKKTNLFVFGGAGGNGIDTTCSFPASTFTTTSTGGLSGNTFGGFSSSTPATATSTDVKTLFTFGPATSAPSQTSQTPFTFGTPQAKPAVTTVASSAPFSFEKKTPFDAVTPAGGGGNTAGSSVFGGGGGGTAAASIFGNSNSTSVTIAAANPVFGTASVPVFGANAAATSTASTTTTVNTFSSGGSIFSGGGFGQPQGQQGGGSNEWGKSTTFGGFGASTAAAATVTKSSTTPGVSPFAFGQENKTNSVTPTAGIFGAAPAAPSNTFGSSDKPFSFGGAAAAAPFQFGGGATAPAAATTTSASPFSFSTSNSTAPPVFGGATSGGTFSFGQTEAPKPPPPAFGTGVAVFGGQQNPPVFGATNSAPAFNFTGSSNPAAQPPGTPQQQPFAFGGAAAGVNQQGGSPMFSIGSSGQTAQRRPYRHATRRLNK